MSLKDVRDTLLQISNPAAIIRHADKEMQKRIEQGSMYVLPAQYAWLEPLLVYYTEDLAGWCKFVKSVRNRLDKKSDEYKAVRDYYKALNVRHIQRRTRNLTDISTSLAVRKGLIPDTFDAKQRYAKRCVQAWALRRRVLLENCRMACPNKRLSLEDQEEILADFWENIEREVNNGEIPAP